MFIWGNALAGARHGGPYINIPVQRRPTHVNGAILLHRIPKEIFQLFDIGNILIHLG